MTKEGKKAVKEYLKSLKKSTYPDAMASNIMLRCMTDEEIEKAIRPAQEKFIKRKISNIASRLYDDLTFDNILYVVKEFNGINFITTDDPKSLDDLYSLVSQFLTKINYGINNCILGPSREARDSVFTYFSPILGIHNIDKDEFNSLFSYKSNGKFYTGIIGTAMKQNRSDLVMKILKNIVVPFFENYNNKCKLIEESDYTYESSILTNNELYKQVLEFVEEFDIKFNLEKELYFDCFGKVMASMCLPVKKKEDYELNKDRIKEEFTRPSHANDRLYSELFYEVLYRNFSKKEKQDLVDLYIQNTIRSIKKCKDEQEQEQMLIDMCIYHTESINVVSEMWDTFKQYLIKNDMYPYNSSKQYYSIVLAFLYHYTIDDSKKFQNYFFLPNEFIIEESKINNEEATERLATYGFLQTLKKNNCTLILNDIYNNIIKPMPNDARANFYYVLEWFNLNGYEI